MLEIIFKLLTTGLLFIIAWTDWKSKRIPDRYTAGMMLTGMISMWIFPEINLLQRMIGIFVVSVPLLLLTYFIPGSIGGGDIKLMAAGGFLFGAAGVWQAFEAGVLCAGGYVLYLLIRKKAERKSVIALGPFLCIGMLLVLLRI